MNKIRVSLYILALGFLAACTKDAERHPSLEVGRISIERVEGKDTIPVTTQVEKDSAVIIGLRAVLSGQPSGYDHIVRLRVDTSKLSVYRSRYGKAKALPEDNYLFFRPEARIAAGTLLSDSLQLNVIRQTMLKSVTEYILPIVIYQIDGNADAVSNEEVVFLKVKTDKSSQISRFDWTILSVSSGGSPEVVLDNNVNTSWSSLSGTPQHIAFDFADEITFSGVTYSCPAYIFAAGGYPAVVKIEVSNNGTDWIDKGTYNGNDPTNPTWTQSIGETTARYLRFNIVDIVPFLGTRYFVYISEFSLIP